LAVKAVCGRYGGAVCTSANAKEMLKWALSQGDGVLFIPDKNLAQNTAQNIGLSPDAWHIIDISGQGRILREEPEAMLAAKARLCIWPGCCAIHARFKPAQVLEARRSHSGCTVLVHPECSPEVADLADFVGSTSTMIKTVNNAPKGSVLIVGTEWHLVNRLALRHAEHKTVLPLAKSICSDMTKTTEEKLLGTLQNIVNGTAEPITVDREEAALAQKTLQTMLDVCA
jgi:quinolinate synthase